MTKNTADQPEQRQTDAQSQDGLTTAFGLIFAGRKPYSADEQGEKTFSVHLYGQEPRTFKARDYAHNYTGQSFREDSRAAGDLGGMVERIERVRAEAEKYLKRVPTAEAEIHAAYNHFAKRHMQFSLAYIGANQSLMSAMITGPSNFPVARQRKLSDRHHAKYQKLTDHIKIGQKSVKRAAFPYGDPREAIRSNNPEAVELLKEKITKLEGKQDYYKKANRDVKASLKKDDPKAFLIAKGYDERLATAWLSEDKYSWMKGRAFDSYVLTNNLATIKTAKARLASLEAVKATDTPNQDYELEYGESFELVRNTDAMRIQLLFGGKPSNLTRAALKSAGFRWAPSQEAWQRHLNNNGEYALKRLLQTLEAKESEAA